MKKICFKVILLISISPMFLSNITDDVDNQRKKDSSSLVIEISGEKLPPIVLPDSKDILM